MAKFYPLFVRRSDGSLVVTARNGKRERNEPTPEQLDPTPDAKGVSDYYRLLNMQDAKYADWMKKLGGMLIREIGGTDHAGPDKSYILYQLPENYRLYEHIKTKAQPKDAGPAGSSKGAKTHAGGNNERQDAYLYGHPLGKKKRYRSPADFFPHLLWLATDSQGDPDNCTCKVCAPDELQPEEERVKPEPSKKEDMRTSVQAHVVIDVPQRPPSASTQSVPVRAQTPTNHTLGKALAPQPTSAPPARELDSQVDSQYNRFVYRPGELVWYCKGAAWGLAIVVRRFGIPPAPNARGTKGYLVQPLSMPLQPEQQVPIFQEDHMRPWLAWSPPVLTLQGLGSIPNVSLDSVDWQGAMSGRYGQGDPQVDASILAARAIDSCYSHIRHMGSTNTGAGVEHRYNGIFIGAEKFWIGDPARLKPGAGRDVLVITDIIERYQNASDVHSATQLVGDVYRPIDVPAGGPIPSEPNLPSRMREDMARRNAITVPTKRIQCYWKLVSPQVSVGLDAIKGRWYEATLLTPILFSEEEYNGRIARGEIYEVGGMMNARGDAQTDPTRQMMPMKTNNRNEALGSAVPKGLVIVDGTEPPSDAELAKMMSRSNLGAQQGQQSEVPIHDMMDFVDTGGE